MRLRYAFFATLSLSLTLRTGAKTFRLKDEWCGEDFFEGWNWFTDDDPTHGRVNYVGKDEARSKNLTYGTFFLLLPKSPPPILPLFRSPFESIHTIRLLSERRQVHHACRRSVHRRRVRAWARQHTHLVAERVRRGDNCSRLGTHAYRLCHLACLSDEDSRRSVASWRRS